jgi:DNA (cytosine-5)-methyltransferase 1
VKYLSVCSGIEAASVAFHPLGWQPWAFAETDKFPSAVLAHHYPTVPNLGDMTKFRGWPDATIDLLVGGTPCQSFSVAGLRAGLADPRGNLALTYLAIADRYRPQWVVWENVPGVLSSSGGRDFGAFLGGLGELGYGWAYRILDAQYFGLAQRRKRVFVVGCLGDWRRATAVLFERESLSGDSAPRREAGQVAPSLPSRRTAGGGLCSDFDCDGGVIVSTGDVSHCLNAGGMGRIDYESETLIAHSLRADGFDASEDGTGRGTPIVAFAENQRGELVTSDTMGALKMGGGKPGQGYPAVQQHMSVRRLTPRECERLQGFPDDYTLIPYRGKPAADGPRYKALGNSFAVPVVRWIGERIALVDQAALEQADLEEGAP